MKIYSAVVVWNVWH